MKQTDLAYLAGIFDADGTIGIKRSTYAIRVTGDSSQPTFSERIHIRQVDRQALELLSETFGGNIGVEKPSAPGGKPLFRWGQTDRKAAAALKAMLPYLRIKKRQAENCLHLRTLKEKSKKVRYARSRGHVGTARRPLEIGEAMEAAYHEAKRLNRVGKEDVAK